MAPRSRQRPGTRGQGVPHNGLSEWTSDTLSCACNNHPIGRRAEQAAAEPSLFLFGGNNEEQSFADLWVLNIETWVWWKPNTSGEDVSPRIGAARRLCTGVGCSASSCLGKQWPISWALSGLAGRRECGLPSVCRARCWAAAGPGWLGLLRQGEGYLPRRGAGAQHRQLALARPAIPRFAP